MPYPNVTDALPWWAQQGGQPQSGQPTPPGYGGTSWLNYLASMFAPGSAQAGENDPTAALKAALAAKTPQQQPPDLPVPPSVNNAPVPPAPAQPQPDPVGNYNAVVGNHGSWPTTSIGLPPKPANVPAANAQPVASAAPPGPLASGGAGGNGATSNPRFVQLDQGQNADPTARRGGPQMTALNLSGLFGGGPQGNPSATPRAGVPGASSPPRVPGPMAQGAVNHMMQNYPGLINASPDQLGSYMNTQPWLKNLGGGAMTTPGGSAGLTAAIHKPNWWNNLGNA